VQETDLDACLDEAELAQDLRDHCLVDLRACQFRLDVRTPTVAAVVLVEPSAVAPEPRASLDLPLALALVAAGLAAGALGALALSR
jgi:hypothetical protein